MSQPSPSSARPNGRFIAWAGGLLVAGVVLFLFIAKLSVFELELHAILAAVLGVGFTIALAVGLMALAFHSARSGHDDEIGD